ncbi:hypothetical protein BZA77DRAFT_347287 [Pyronema omphalodes]|nr:hypothetical protein BZA77DRAFT_347287 [Pyronema omphalodes]
MESIKISQLGISHRILIILSLMTFIEPTFGASDTAIGTSADAWATLVANIAPLLVLVGEKHVKAYFKIMCRTSHHLLYAAGPIGLVTAVTTLVRLNGTKTVKRMIGRQFETRAEVLADVTSVSAGDVSVELKNGSLEQTTNPSLENLAMFYVHGRKEGNARVVLEYVAGILPVMGPIIYGSVPTASQQYSREWQKTTVACFRAGGDEVVEKVRKVSSAFWRSSNLDDKIVQRLAEDECDACAAFFASWTDVSLDLTASHCLDNILTDTARIFVAGFCILTNVVIIVMNWWIQRDAQNCALVAVGLAISTIGSFITARLVDAASDEITVDLNPLSATRSGFYSNRIREGSDLSFCPKAVVVSSIAVSRPTRRRIVRVLTDITVLTMVIGYVALYLGLRKSEWWAALAILFTSAIASMARAWFVPDKLELRERDSGGPEPYPFECILGTESARQDLLFKDEKGTVNRISEKSQEGLSTLDPAMASNEFVERLKSPAIIGPHYYRIVYDHGSSEALKPSSVHSNRFFLATVLSLTIRLRKRRLVPLELSDDSLQDNGPIISPLARIILSDLLFSSGVWRQPLEIVVTVADIYHTNPMESFFIPLLGWYWRAITIRKQGNPAIRIIESNLDNALNVKEISRQVFSKFEEDSGWEFREHDYLWMAVKIASAVFVQWTTERLEQFCATNLDAHRQSILDDQEQDAFLDIVKDLTVPM